MIKADRIRHLAARGWDDWEIQARIQAEFSYCTRSYVRTCARQRVTGSSEADKRYDAKCRSENGGVHRNVAKYRSDPEYAERKRSYWREWSRDRWRRDPAYRAAQVVRTRNWRARQRQEAALSAGALG